MEAPGGPTAATSSYASPEPSAPDPKVSNKGRSSTSMDAFQWTMYGIIALVVGAFGFMAVAMIIDTYRALRIKRTERKRDRQRAKRIEAHKRALAERYGEQPTPKESGHE